MVNNHFYGYLMNRIGWVMLFFSFNPISANGFGTLKDWIISTIMYADVSKDLSVSQRCFQIGVMKRRYSVYSVHTYQYFRAPSQKNYIFITIWVHYQNYHFIPKPFSWMWLECQQSSSPAVILYAYNLLRVYKNHPGHQKALKIVGQDFIDRGCRML